MDDKQREAFDQWFDSELDPELNLTPGDKELCRHAWQAALSHAEGEAPAAYMYRFADPISGHPVWRFDPGTWNGQKPKESKPLYTHPAPTGALELDRYDAGVLGGNDDCPTGWWHDYIRSELEAAHDFYQQQVDGLARPAPQVSVPEGWRHALEEALAMMTSQSMTLERQADAVTGIRDLLAAPTAPQVAGWRSGYPEYDGDGGVCHIPLDGHPDFMVVAFNRDGALVDSCGDDVGYSLEDVGRWRPIDALSHAEGEASAPNYLMDALDNLVHDNYERGYRGAQNRQDDAELIRCALRRSHPAPQVAEGCRDELYLFWDAQAYASMRDEIEYWKRRAQESDDALERIREDLSPTHMGEPVLPDDLLTMLVRRLAHALRKAAPDNDLAEKAMDYLRRKHPTALAWREATAEQPVSDPDEVPDEREIAKPVDIDAEYEAFCRWVSASKINVDYRLHTHSGRRVSDGAYIRDEDARRMFRAWRERATRLRAGKEGE